MAKKHPIMVYTSAPLKNAPRFSNSWVRVWKDIIRYLLALLYSYDHMLMITSNIIWKLIRRIKFTKTKSASFLKSMFDLYFFWETIKQEITGLKPVFRWLSKINKIFCSFPTTNEQRKFSVRRDILDIPRVLTQTSFWSHFASDYKKTFKQKNNVSKGAGVSLHGSICYSTFALLTRTLHMKFALKKCNLWFTTY